MATPIFDVATHMISPEMVARSREYLATDDTTPLRVDLDLTSDCNYQCRHCGDLARGLLNRGGLSQELIEPLLDDLKVLRVHEVILIGGGEPTRSPHFVETVRGLRQRGLRYGLVTNGSQLTPAMLDALHDGCDWVRISLDAATAKTYAMVHKPEPGIHFENVVANTRRMIERLGSRAGVSYLVTPLNAHELARAARLVKGLGAAYLRVRPMQHPLTGAAVAWPARIDLRAEVKRAKALADGTFQVSIGETMHMGLEKQEKVYGMCHAQAFATTIAGDGAVYVCSKWRGESWACIGDLREERLWAIWHGARRQKLVQGLNPSRRCQHVYCHAHPLNDVLDGAVRP